MTGARASSVKEDLGLIIKGAKKGYCQDIEVAVHDGTVVLQMLS